VSAKEVKMAEALVESAVGEAFEPDKYRDKYREQVLDLIERKAAGEEFEAARTGCRGAEGRRPDGGAGSQREGGQGRPQAPPCRRPHEEAATKTPAKKASSKSSSAVVTTTPRDREAQARAARARDAKSVQARAEAADRNAPPSRWASASSAQQPRQGAVPGQRSRARSPRPR
jgi:DNA end-binding protein Ku